MAENLNPEITHQPGSKVHVLITREPFMDFFKLTLDNGHWEELEVEDAMAWFQEHNANMDAVEKALDHCWNFRRSEVNINSFRLPKRILAHEPNIN